MPSLAMRASAYWLAKLAIARRPNSPTMTTPGAQTGRVRWVKPSSSRGLSRAGMVASLNPPMSVPATAMTQPMRYCLK